MMNTFQRLFPVFILTLGLTALVCGLSACEAANATAPTDEPASLSTTIPAPDLPPGIETATSTEPVELLPTNTAMAMPAHTATDTPALAAPEATLTFTPATDPTDSPASAEIQCQALRNLFVRTGPGTAYRAAGALAGGELAVATHYNSQGYAGGAWAKIRQPGVNLEGWVSVESQNLSCDGDLTSLPGLNVPPPPPTATATIKATSTSTIQTSATPTIQAVLPPNIGSSSVLDGQCFDNIICTPTFSNATLLRLEVNIDGNSAGDDLIKEVRFSVSDSNFNIMLQSTDGDYPFCIFGGACAGWPYEGNAFKWQSGGQVVQPGTYTISVFIVRNDGSEIFWLAEVTLTP